jgi:hypothetical protein
MFNQQEFAPFAALDLEPIKFKLMHPEAGEGWSAEKTESVEAEYRRFLFLMKKFPQEATAPAHAVDTFWHYHILDTMKYAADCEALFGYFLHHFPYIGLRGADDAAALERIGARMGELYQATFGETYLAGAAAWCGAANAPAEAAWCGAATNAEAKAAWCGAATEAQAAWCGAATEAPEFSSAFYTARPAPAKAAA